MAQDLTGDAEDSAHAGPQTTHKGHPTYLDVPHTAEPDCLQEALNLKVNKLISAPATMYILPMSHM